MLQQIAADAVAAPAGPQSGRHLERLQHALYLGRVLRHWLLSQHVQLPYMPEYVSIESLTSAISSAHFAHNPLLTISRRPVHRT